jgi:peptide/nickel transport system permease protein
MARFLLVRLGLASITLVLLSGIVFVATQVLPGDVARSILGPTADARSVAVLHHQLGLDRPLSTQYWEWISGFVRGDFGTSYTLRTPIRPMVFEALGNSLKLAALALVIVAPLSILGGVVAAMNVGRWPDRVITTAGLSFMVLPEFVTGIVVLVVFGVQLEWLPVSATAPPGSGLLTQVEHLLLPAIPLTCVLFGYIARVARAGTIEALDADYTRTAVLKGLPRRTVIVRHVLRNALLPTITVISTQVGYLVGGLVVIEILFNYHGIGLLIFQATQNKDFPLLESGILCIGVLYLLVTLLADVAYSVLNPRIREASQA